MYPGVPPLYPGVPPVLEEVLVDVYPGVPPLDVEVEGVRDGEVSVIDYQHVTNVKLNLDQVRLEIYNFVRCFAIKSHSPQISH